MVLPPHLTLGTHRDTQQPKSWGSSHRASEALERSWQEASHKVPQMLGVLAGTLTPFCMPHVIWRTPTLSHVEQIGRAHV